VSLLQDELDKRFFNKTETTKNWLMNDAVLSATLVTPGSGSMLKKFSTREGQDDAMDCAHAAGRSTSSHLLDDHPAPPLRRGKLEGERKKCRTSLIGWDSEESQGACDDTPHELATQKLDHFLKTSVPADYDGALRFRDARRDEYSLLHLVACLPLGASGSYVASERDFSVAGLVLREDRSTLLAEHLETHCLVRFNAHLLLSDLSLIPPSCQAARLSARTDMQPLANDMHSG